MSRRRRSTISKASGADEHRDVRQRVELRRVPYARGTVDRAHAAEHVTVDADDRKAGVGDDVEVDDREVRAQDGVHPRVLDDERRVAGDDVLAEGMRQRRLARVRPRLADADDAGEVLARVGHERDDGDRRTGGTGRDARETVEDRLGTVVGEPLGDERREPFREADRGREPVA